MNLIGYVRVSTRGQVTDGDSLEEQRERLESWCAGTGHKLLTIYADEGVSGTIEPTLRPGMHQALMALREKAWGAEGLVALDLSRLSRDVSHLLALFKKADRDRFSICLIKDAIDTSTAAGRLLLAMLGATHQFVRDNISERTAMALQHRRAKGLSTGRAPIGTRRVVTDGVARIVPEPEEQRMLRRLCNLYDKGWRAYRIANDLNERGFRTRSGRAFTYREVEAFIKRNGIEVLKTRAWAPPTRDPSTRVEVTERVVVPVHDAACDLEDQGECRRTA